MITPLLDHDDLQEYSHTHVIAAAVIAETYPITYGELADRLDCTRGYAYKMGRRLERAGLVIVEPVGTSDQPRANTRVHECRPTQTLEALVDGERRQNRLSNGQKHEAIIQFLARRHYVKRLSAARSRQVAEALPGDVDVNEASRWLLALVEDGVVERIESGSRGGDYYRLRMPADVAPHRAPATGGGSNG